MSETNAVKAITEIQQFVETTSAIIKDGLYIHLMNNTKTVYDFIKTKPQNENSATRQEAIHMLMRIQVNIDEAINQLMNNEEIIEEAKERLMNDDEFTAEIKAELKSEEYIIQEAKEEIKDEVRYEIEQEARKEHGLKWRKEHINELRDEIKRGIWYEDTTKELGEIKEDLILEMAEKIKASRNKK